MAKVYQYVRALYDFEAQENSSEISLSVGDVLIVTRKDIGEGWWEGILNGVTGLFPAAYVEEITDHNPPSIPPPPVPREYDSILNEDLRNVYSNHDVPFTNWQLPMSGSTATSGIASQHIDADEDWDDDDDWEDGSSSIGITSAETKIINDRRLSQDSLINDGRASVRKNLNRFSKFVKSGGEDYILGNIETSNVGIQKNQIIDTGKKIIWKPVVNSYTCSVTSPKKSQKLKGLKTFIQYQLTPSFNNNPVFRRYKHFDWLHERLEEKYIYIPIPPLPDKQVTGRYEEHFIERRMSMLQTWVSRICRHPVLSQSEVWIHFLTCHDEKNWKAGKRKAEHDEFTGAKSLFCIEIPETPIRIDLIESEIEHFRRFVENMDTAVRLLYTIGSEQVKKCQTIYRREYQKIGDSFRNLGNAFDDGCGQFGSEVEGAIKFTGEVYEKLGLLIGEQPRNDWYYLLDILHDHKGMLSSWPEILSVVKGALQKKKECEKSAQEGRMAGYQLHKVNKRTDLVSCTVIAEINHYRDEHTEDLKSMLKNFLNQQIIFHSKMAAKLQDCLHKFVSNL